ncbi:MAG: hypothetical protein MUE46_06860 [Xanthomonadales bacterium]|jgi:hypothetical protein|nr:hypothetical protein [Xanthomonadales bacterium]
MTGLLTWWVVLAALAVWLASRRGAESPLMLTYFFALSMIHVGGAINYLGGSVMLYHERETYEGFRLTLIGLSAMLVVVFLLRVLKLVESSKVVDAPMMPMRTVYRVIGLGALTYFVMNPLSWILPSGTVISATLAGLLPLGFWFWVHNAARSDAPWQQLPRIAAVAVLLPVATLLGSGFLGFGVSLALTIAVMVLVVWPQKSPFVLAMPLIGYLGLSLGASYMIHRNDIRDAVWGGEDLRTRIQATTQIFTDFRFYDVNDPETVAAVESRFNQNVLVGLGLQSHASGFAQLQYGATVPLWSLIPRVLWPDKPDIGGGRTVVSDFTGIYFTDGTSVGAGNPLEFYINFGWAGVIGGFALLGGLLGWHDRNLVDGLRANDLRKVVLYGLPGLTLINPGGNLLEVFIAFIAAQFVARAFVVVLGSAFVARLLGFEAAVATSKRPAAGRLRPSRQER